MANSEVKNKAASYHEELLSFFTAKNLPFWFDRAKDEINGGFITHFDKDGNDTGEDEKSLIAQSRFVYTMSSAYRHGYGEKCKEFADHGVDFLLNNMWDKDYGGFYWTMDRAGKVKQNDKIIYGHSFAIYALSEYTLATGDSRGLEYAEKTFDLLQKYCSDTMYGGYFEMFSREWALAGPGSAGGDRKTLDVHMHLMEAFTSLYECSGKEIHKRKLIEDINILLSRMLHSEYSTGIPQFRPDWRIAPQIKFDIVWGWDRFKEDGVKLNAEDNTSYGHNVELAWLLIHALSILGEDIAPYEKTLLRLFNHAVEYGIDSEYGGVYVEGYHTGEATDLEKEFWQQNELMIGMLTAYLCFGDEKYFSAYENIHRFVFDKGINHDVGEMWPLLTREGRPIWTHMSHSWKINYHSIRCMVKCIELLKDKKFLSQ